MSNLETIAQDVRHGLRALQRGPTFTIAALVTLALGIGATTAIFSVVNAALLKPPPYPDPDRLFVLTSPDGGVQSGQIFHAVRGRLRSFSRIAAQGGGTGWNLVAGGRAEYVTGLPVSHEYFDVLGARPLVGRVFTEAEDRPNGPRTVVLGESVWRRLLAARPDAVGEPILLGGVAHTIVGVMPAAFQTSPPAEMWTPLQLSPTDATWNYPVIGRITRDATAARAASELDAVRTTLRQDLPNVSERRLASMRWMPYQRWLGLGMRDELLLLLGAVAFLLLIACVNVASLQLARAVARRSEMAVRTALGGSRLRLTRQVLTESVLLALGGALAGLVVARSGTTALLQLVPPNLVGSGAVDVDWRVLSVTLGVSLASGLLAGLAPAAGAARIDVKTALWSGGRHTAGRATMGLRRGFVVLEVALAVVLLVGAGLLIRTFVNLRRAPPGFDPAGVVVGRMSLQGSALSKTEAEDNVAVFAERTLARLRALPGVTAAAMGNNVPVERGLNLAIDPPPDARISQMRAVDWRYVTADYFDVFRIPVRAGRGFDDRDRAGRAPVAIVNDAFARTYFGPTAIVGRSIHVARTMGDVPREIIAVVGDVKSQSGAGWTRGANALAAAAPPTVYVPLAQVPDGILREVHHYFPVSWAVRSQAATVTLIPSAQQVLASVAPTLPVIRFETMDEIIANDLQTERFLMTLLAVFAATAMALAATGMYGLTAYTVSQRTKEVGIRMAIGASGARVLGTFLVEGAALACIGLAVGFGAAIVLGRLLASIIFDVTPRDPMTFAAVTAVLFAVVGVATLLPAIQAARIDPVRALRLE